MRQAKFLAIVGFCMIGLLVIGAIFAGSMFSAMGADMPVPGFFITFMYLLLALFYFFPIYYLFKFAKHIRLAIVSKSTSDLESALENLKSHYKFIGILMIVILSIYVLFGGGAMLAAAFFG
jgi:flagellar motor component MotA